MSTKAQSTASLSTEENRTDVQQALLTGRSYQAKTLNMESKESPGKIPPASSSSLPQSHAQPQSICKTFTVPKSSGQFQADWRALQKQPEQLFYYFKVISLFFSTE